VSELVTTFIALWSIMK